MIVRHFGGSALLLAGLTAVGCVWTCVPGECATNWPMWMENPTHTPTPQFEPESPLAVAWTAGCGGVFGGPVVYEGMVYFASGDGHLYALDDNTGHRRWLVQVSEPDVEWGEPAEELRRGRVPSPGLMATPAVDENCVYVGGLDGNFHARDRLTGELVWDQAIAGAITSSPLLADDMLVVGTRQGELVAMDRRDGGVMWTHDAGAPINSSPAFAGGKVVVGTGRGIIAVAAATGEPAWEHQFLDGGKCDASPCIVGDRVYAATWGGAVCALSLSEGERVWERSVARAPIFASPTVAGGLVYVASTDGILAALEAESGDSVWETVTPGYRGRPTAAYASPVICGRVVLMGCNAGRIAIFDARTGVQVNEITELHRYVHGTPVVTDEALYVASELRPLAPYGTVVKFACGTEEMTVTAQRYQFAGMACQELGLLEAEPPREMGVHGGWALPPERRYVDQEALNRLVELGLIASPEAWRRGRLGPFQLAAFYYNLFFDPNPFGVELPEFAGADLTNARTFPTWVRNAPQLAVGLGLMEAPEGRFGVSGTLRVAEVRSSLQRARELLEEFGRAEG